VQLDRELARVLQREQVVRRLDDGHAGRELELPRRHRARLLDLEAEDRLLDVGVERQNEGLEVPDDLMDILDDAGDGLVLMQDAVDPEAPDGGAAERGEQHPAQRVAERVAEAPLERLDDDARLAGRERAHLHHARLEEFADGSLHVSSLCPVAQEITSSTTRRPGSR